MGLISLLFQEPILFFVAAFALVVTLTIHEFAHAFVADKLGDPTPRYQERVTLNPLAHLDPIGTLMIFLIGFGWGKPVQFDPYNLENPVKDTALIAFAGPLSNILLAIVLAVVAPFLGDFPLLAAILNIVLYFNVMLAIFNLVPVHPLDGGKILVALLPKDVALEYDQFMHRYGMYVLIALLLPWGENGSAVSAIIGPIIATLINLLNQLSVLVA